MPTSPASRTAYSCWIALSLICATMGAAWSSAAERPSAVSRLCCRTIDRMANSKSGERPSIRFRTASSPWAIRSSHGSVPSGETAIEVRAANFWSSSNARSAAFCPAASPSKVKTTSPALCELELSISSRRRILTCSPPKAVPQVAMAVVTPARWHAMTSVYPSTTTARFDLAMSRLARSIPYSTWDLW